MTRAIYAPVPANHVASACISASTQAGLTTPRPVATSTNSGTLVLRATNTPGAATALDVRLQSGGRPSGWTPYSFGVAIGRGALGAAVAWKYSTDSTVQWRGYSESIYLTSVEFPVTYSANNGPPGTPRTLGDGTLGWVQPTGTNAVHFYKVTAAGVASSSVIASGSYLTTARSDCVVLPDGTIIAICKRTANSITSFRSADHGATWTELGQTTIPDRGIALNAELVGSDIVLVHGSETAAADTAVYVSSDGGASFSWVTDTAAAHRNPRTCVIGGKILMTSRLGVGAGLVYPIVPGGDLGTAVAAGTLAGNVHAIGARDDGTIWFFQWEAAAAANLQMAVYVSTDGGASFADAAGVKILDLETTGYASTGYDHLSVGTFRGELIMLARVASGSGTDGGIHLMRWGGYGTVTEARNQTAYEHGYTPVDYPQNVGWTKTDVAAGATLTNQGPLNIVSTAANNSWFRSSANIWTTATGGRKLVRFRVRVNSGGGVADNRAYFRFIMDDGVNQQAVLLRFSTTTCRVIREDTGNTIADITDDFTQWTDFFLAMTHDGNANAAAIQLWHRQDADNFIWTEDVQGGSSFGEVVGTLDCMEFGGSAAGAVNWDIAFIQIADSDSGGSSGAGFASQGCDNPTDLVGRSLNSTYPVVIGLGVGLTGGNAGGITGDTYDLDAAYAYGAANVWAELRPSRHVRASADSAVWNAVYDAGASGLFTAGLIAVFGTNVRTLTVEMHASDSWGSPSFSAALDATVYAGSKVDSGPGYIRLSGPPMVPHEFRSDGDGHRWFLEIDTIGGGVVYEITGNDKDTIYVDGVDLTGAVSVGYVFGDRMGRVIEAGALPPRYRFARISIGSRETADNYYRVGTLVLAPVNEVDRSYDLGYVDRVTPTVEVTELDTGYRASSRTGPRRWEIGMQWAPVNGMQFTAARAMQAIYEACDGSHRPLVFWRDPHDLRTLHLCRIQETFTSQGLRGEGATAVRMVNQLVLSEEL